MAPNILLVVLDALRRDAIEPYGAPAGATPTIASLARSGAALPSAYATASWTLPSHVSMFTGLLARSLGLGQAPGGGPQGSRPVLEGVRHRLLAEVLRGAGYATHGFSTNLWVSPHSGLDLGFDTFTYAGEQRVARSAALSAEGRRSTVAWALEGLRARSDDGAAHMRRLLIDSIEQRSERPRFWFVNLCECHSPYLPPRPWNDLAPSERIRAGLEAHRHLSFESICLYAAGRHRIPAAALQRMRHLYGRAASYMDQWLADILGALDARDALQDTLVLVTSDHGENFGEGGLIAHGFSVDQRLIHVPLVISGPGAIDVERPFSLAELPRVIADAAGLERHPWREPELPAGVAVAQYDPLGSASNPRVQEWARRWRLDEEAVARVTAGYTCATDGRLKLVRSGGAELVYDLEHDPGEEAPLGPAELGGTVERLRAALAHPGVAAGPEQRAEAQPPMSASPEELEAIERQMRMLGYM